MVHLHVHSRYSLLEGVADIADLVRRAVECRMTALALTDTAALHGAVPFYRAAREAGLKPILGALLDGALLLARDREGYAQLCRIVTAYRVDDRFDAAACAASEHLVVLVATLDEAERFRRLGGDPCVAVTHYGDPRSRARAQRLRDAALRLRFRPVAVNPVYFLHPQDNAIHRVLSAIRLNTTLDALPPGRLAPPGCWFRSPEQMRALYGDWPETLENTERLAEQCNLELELGKPLFPRFDLPGAETPFSYLWKQAFEGVKRRYIPLTRPIIRRLEHELDVIERLGFAPYFIIVQDIVRFARSHDIPVVGRGSAANSVVAYALGITRVDPFRYNLYFERFLNPSRGDCPDIDLDICWRRRDRVVDYVYRRYGDDRVAMICSFNTFQARSAVREIARAFGMPDREIGRITRRLPHYHAGDIRAVVRHLPESRRLPIHEEPLKSIVALGEAIDGFPRHLSLHPCGLVIAPDPLTRFLPLQRAAKGILVTQYDMHAVESLGLVKMDLLGHRSLTVIDDAVHAIRHNRGISIDIDALPDPDPATAEMLRAGHSIGCFQIESPAMRSLLQNTRAADTDMLIKTLSLVRPGPSGSGMKKRFIDRHLGREAVTYLDPALESVLGDTYGVMLYQEDILKVAHVIAGMDLAEADSLRRAMTKRRSPVEMAAAMKDFVERAVARGAAPGVAEELAGLIANFAAYSYCKAHACTYGEIAYQCSYLKAHFPAEFLAAVLSNRGGFYHPAVYLEEIKRLGIEVRPPHIHRSRFEYTVEDDAVRVGFLEIRNLSRAAVDALLEQREHAPFIGLADLWSRVELAVPEAEALIHAGACDAFGRTRPALLWELRMLARARTASGPRRVESAPRLFHEVGEGGARAVPRLPDYSRRRRGDLEWIALGMPASTHPLEYHAALAFDRALVLSADLPAYAQHTVTALGWLIAERRVALKDRGCMKFCTFEDPKGVFEGVLFPEVYQRYGGLLDSHGPFLVTGNVQEEDHHCSIIVERIERPDDIRGNSGGIGG